MGELLQNVLSASFYGGIVIIVVLFLRLLLKKAPKNLLCLLWLLAAVRLLMPFELESSFSLQPRIEPLRQDTAVQSPMPEIPAGNTAVRPEGSNTDVVIDVQPIGSNPPASVVPGTDTPAAVPPEPAAQPEVGGEPNWAALVTCLWLAVALGLALYSVVSYCRLKRSVRSAVILSEGVWLCPEQSTAFVLGFFRPQIYLPAGLSEQERQLVLLHERTHISRGDPWWKLLGFGVLTLHWFNPLVWVAYLCLCKDLEMACDERVVRSMDVAERKAYSSALLSCSVNRRSIAACPVAFGEVSVKARIKSVLNYRKPIFWVTVIAVVAIIFVAVCFLTSPRDVVDATGATDAAEPTEPDASLEDSNEWGVVLYASAATPRGMALICEQDGSSVNGTLGTGSYYWLEQWTDSGWVRVEEIPPEDGIERIWTAELKIISDGGRYEKRYRWSVDWSGLYGELSPGTYRLGKIITLYPTGVVKQSSVGEDVTMYARFTVESTNPSELTEENVIDLCAEAYTELHEADAYGVHHDNYGTADTYEWYAGEHCYIDVIPNTRFDYLSYGDSYFHVSQEMAQSLGVPAGWINADYPIENQIYLLGSTGSVPFWKTTTWEEWGLALEGWAETADALICEFTAKEAPETTYILTLDRNGHLTSLECLNSGETAYIRTFLSLDYAYIENVIAQKYQEASSFVQIETTVLDPATDEELILRCREAMRELLDADELYVEVQRLDEYEDRSEVYLRADRGWLYQYQDPGTDCETVKWLSYDAVQYLYDEVLDENGNMLEYYRWQLDPQPESHVFQLPAPFTLNWDAIELEFEDRQLDLGIESITLRSESRGETFIFYFNTLKKSLPLQYFDVLSYHRGTLTESVRYYVNNPYTYITNDGTVSEHLQTVYTAAAAQINAPTEARDEEFYAELFAREFDIYTEGQWSYDLIEALYREPEEFVRQLSRKYREDPARAEDIISHIGQKIPYRAPVRFARLMTRLGADPALDQQIIGLLIDSYEEE